MPERPPEPRAGAGGDATRIVDLAMQTRADVRMLPETVNAEHRSVEVVWSTGAAVRRRDPWTGKRYDEVLSLDETHVDLSRLNGGAPLLNTHGAWDLSDVIGVVERAWIAREGEALVGRARVRFSDRAAVEPIWRDVAAGIIRNVSVGYSVRTYEITETDGAPAVWRAVDWQPLELSAVPVGADAAAGFRAADQRHTRDDPATTPCHLLRRVPAPIPKESPMTREAETETTPPATTETTPPVAAVGPAEPAADPLRTAADAPLTRGVAHTAAATPAPTVAPAPAPSGLGEADVQVAAERARAEERHRIATIHDAAQKLGVAASVADDLVARGMALDAARAALIDAAAARDAAQETRPHIRTGGLDASETRRAAVEAALLHRYDPGRFALSDAAREWRGLSLIEMARGWLEAEGVRVRGLSRDEIATRALHTTSDFPAILAGVTNKTLRGAYETAPRTYTAIARRTTVADFKLVHRLQLGEAPQLERVNESGEFKRGTIGEAQETYRIETFGKVIGITREVIINDDLDAFTRVPSLFGTAAATLESDVVWSIFTQNPAMADGAALFHASHKNLAGAGAALDVAGLAKARTAMAQQRGLDGKTILNVRPSFLVVPTALELSAEQLLAQNIVPAKASDVVPSSIRSLAVIAEPRLDPASGAVPWYLVASPAAIDTIEYAYLEGQEGVALETRMGFDVDGIEIRARLDFGAKAIDWRGLHKNPGVALS
jgi:phage major head subunit gpT-like protein